MGRAKSEDSSILAGREFPIWGQTRKVGWSGSKHRQDQPNDEIMEKAGRQRMANGGWSTEDLDWLWEECRRRLGPSKTE